MKKIHKIAIGFGLAMVLAMAMLPAPASRNFGSMALRHPVAASGTSAVVYQKISWEELIPKDWDPLAKFKGKKLGLVLDYSPQAQAMMKELRDIWDNAPTVAALNGRTVRLPGYIVPLEATGGAMREFLLVPYFGACIHTPPPPANQIIHVTAEEPVKGYSAMDAVWLEGTLRTGQRKTDMGASGYTLRLAKIEPYIPPAR